eukprot:CAMPEP_0194394898 /NCGR_PEP_ID=MMETSP0174-20130528/124110_1 /TAXON_ID=216777 /ORGANISM="Proboscia alata, Strain PI-D3" /LENGTH=685 /DNA_ID=CAMNT_0039190747 /DNA_START=74 /DNA_END=2128 /DNA_ORIENTATION=-
MRTESTAPSCCNDTGKPYIPELVNILSHASDFYCHLFIRTQERDRIKCREQFSQSKSLVSRNDDYATNEKIKNVRSLIATFVLKKLVSRNDDYVTNEENKNVRSLIATFVEKTCFLTPFAANNCEDNENEKILEDERDLSSREQRVQLDGKVHCLAGPVRLSMMAENDWENLIQDFSELREEILSGINIKLESNDLDISASNERQSEKALFPEQEDDDNNIRRKVPHSKSLLFSKDHDKYIQELHVQKSLSILRKLVEIMPKKEGLGRDQIMKECQSLIARYHDLVSSTVQKSNENKSALLAVLKPSSSPSNSEDRVLIGENNCVEITSLSDVEALLKKFDLLAFQHRTNKLLQGWESAFFKKPKLLQIYPGCSRKDIDDEVEVVYDSSSGSEDCTDQTSEQLAVLKPSSSPSNSEDGDLIEENNCLEITSLSDVEAILEKFDLLAFQKRTNKLLKALESAALSKPKLLQIYPGCSRKHNDDKGQAGYKNTSIGEDSSQESFEDSFEYSSSDCSSEKVNNETRKKRRKKNPIKERCSRPRDHVSEVISTRNGNLVNETPESDDVSETSPKSRSIMGSKISSSLGRDIKVEVKSARKKTSGVMPKRSEQSMGGEFVRETNDFEKKSNSKSATTNIIDVGDDQSSLFKQERGLKRKPSSFRRKRRAFSEEEKRTLVVGVKEYGEGKW